MGQQEVEVDMTLLLAGWRRLRMLPRWARLLIPMLCAVLLALPAAWPDRVDDDRLLTRVTGPAVDGETGWPDPAYPSVLIDVESVAEVAVESASTAASSTTVTTTPAAAPVVTAPAVVTTLAPTTTVPARPGPLIGPMAPDRLAPASLWPFPGCDELMTHVKDEATKAVRPWGIPWGYSNQWTVQPNAAPASADAGGDFAPHSDTNVQEHGVDEPDRIEVDGRHLFAVDGDRLRVLEATGAAPRLLASVPLAGRAWDRSLLLAGDRLVLLSQSEGAPFVAPDSERRVPVTRVDLFDVSEAASPRLVSSVELNGRRVDARAADGLVRLVVASGATGLPFVAPRDNTEEAKQRALARNREVIAESSPANWLLVARTTRDGNSETEPAVGCDDVHRPDEFAGLESLSIVTFDIATGELLDDTVSVLAQGRTVYSARERLYVGSSAWSPTGLATTTALHQFSLTPGGPATYLASGRVRGIVDGQFALSEHGGRLRVASTELRARNNESFVTILETRGDALVAVGQIGGLGRGEQIYAVRFMGDVGYVVTFRRVDPLYVLDLSDATAPAVLGELKILGYSAYLHPVGEGLLLGVGQDADEDGMTQGTQVSLFDVSDPSQPARLDQIKLGEGWTRSEVEYDHHAFLWWEPEGLAVVPYWAWDRQSGSPRSEAAGIRVEDGRLVEAGRANHTGEPGADPWRSEIRRSAVVGDTLYTVSAAGVLANDVSTFARKGWAKFD